MLTHDDIPHLSIAAGSAVAIGLAFGLWLALPSGPAPAAAEVDAAAQTDPNLAAYQRMLAENGVNATSYVMAPGYAPVPVRTAAEPLAVAEQDIPEEATDTETMTAGQAPENARQAILEPPQPLIPQPSVDPAQQQAGSS